MEASRRLQKNRDGAESLQEGPLWDHLVDKHRFVELAAPGADLRPLAHVLEPAESEVPLAAHPPRSSAVSPSPGSVAPAVPAAVLATFVVPHWDAPVEQAQLLFVRRSRSLRKHPGQIGFPGGRVENEDPGPLEAALREAQEEVRMEPERLRLVGPMSPGETKTGFQLHPFIGMTVQQSFEQDGQEIDEVHLVSLADLLVCPVRYEVRTWHEYSYKVVYFDLPELCIWGITGFLLEEILREYFDWRPRPVRI